MTAFAADLLSLEDYLRQQSAGLFEGNPYLHPAWLQCLATLSPRDAQQHVFQVSAEGRAILVMALTVRTQLGVRICTCLDTGFNNNDSPLIDTARRGALAAFFRQQIGQLLPDVDLFHFAKQQLRTGGEDNPLFHLCHAVTHPNRSYGVDLGERFADFETTRRSSGSLKGLRKKSRRLAQAAGAVTLRKATGDRDINTALDLFFDQRARSEKLGRVPNPFDDLAVQSSLRSAALACSGQAGGLQVFTLAAGAQTVAVSLVLVSGAFQSGFAHSFDNDFAKYSPGRLLEWNLLRAQHQRGIRFVDFGLGDDSYKTEWSDPVQLFDLFLVTRFKGHWLKFLIKTRLFLVRALKERAAGRNAVKRIRLLAASLRKT